MIIVFTTHRQRRFPIETPHCNENEFALFIKLRGNHHISVNRFCGQQVGQLTNEPLFLPSHLFPVVVHFFRFFLSLNTVREMWETEANVFPVDGLFADGVFRFGADGFRRFFIFVFSFLAKTIFFFVT